MAAYIGQGQRFRQLTQEGQVVSRLLNSSEYGFLKSALERRRPQTERLLRDLPRLRVVDEKLRGDFIVKTLARTDEVSARHSVELRSLDLHGEYQDLDGHVVVIDVFVDTNGNLREVSLWKGAPTPIEDVSPNLDRIAIKDE